MPDKKAERPEGQMRRRPMRRRKKVCAFCADALSIMFLREERFFLEESQETVQSIRERLL